MANPLAAMPFIPGQAYPYQPLFGAPQSYIPNPVYNAPSARRGKSLKLNKAHGNAGNIIKIEKIYNSVIYERFINEFKRMQRKYPNKKINDMMKHLFHGSRTTDPKLIYGSEDGLDIRFSNPGAYGTGIYFAKNSSYSNTYAYYTQSKGHQVMQMFCCLVLIGESKVEGPGQYRIPPLKPNS